MGRRRTRRKKQRGGGPSASPAFKHYIPEPAFPPGGSYKVGCPTRKNGYYYQYNCTGGTCPAKSTVGELSPGFGNWIANRAKTVQGQGQQDKNKVPVRRPQRGGGAAVVQKNAVINVLPDVANVANVGIL